MKTYLLFALLLVLLVSNSHAQNDKKWAVGPDLLGLFNVNTLPKYSLYTRYKVGEKSGIRIRPGYYNLAIPPGIFDIKQQKTYSLRVGYERTQPLYKQSLYLLYGVEYIYYNDHQFSFDFNNPTNQQSFLIADYRQSGGGLFIGSRYFILPNLSISTESTFQVTQTTSIKARLGIDEISNTFVSTILFPVTSFNLCVHF